MLAFVTNAAPGVRSRSPIAVALYSLLPGDRCGMLTPTEVPVDWAVAALVGLINIALMRPLSHYRFWLHWLGGRAWLFGYLVYAFAAATTGVLSKFGAQAVGWEPGQHGLGQALLAAIAGATLLRADVGRPVRTGKEQATNLAAPFITWLGSGFDHAAHGQIETWARGLQTDDLETAAGLVASDPGRPGSNVTRALIRSSIKELSGPKKDYARGELVGAIASGYLAADRTRG